MLNTQLRRRIHLWAECPALDRIRREIQAKNLSLEAGLIEFGKREELTALRGDNEVLVGNN